MWKDIGSLSGHHNKVVLVIAQPAVLNRKERGHSKTHWGLG